VSAEAAPAPATAARSGWLRLWWNAHFSDFTRREAWGYGVWLFFGVIVAVPEIWAAFWKQSAPFPTISGTTGALEFDHPWVAMIVAGAIVLCIYSSFRYPKTRTGVLQKRGPDGASLGEELRGDQALPYRTPEGGRFTRSTTPVRDVSAVVYFACALVLIAVCTAVAAIKTDINDEFPVGRTLYGLILLFWVLIPSLAAWPKRFAIDVPFPTLFSTIRSLERRLRVLALLAAAWLVILLFHLVLYPWPSIIPDLGRTHRTYICHPIPPAAHQTADCKKLDEADGKPTPVAP
jgi:hypothetical protein